MNQRLIAIELPVSFALPLCLSFLAYLLKLGHCDIRCRCLVSLAPVRGHSCNFIALCLYHMLLFCSLSLCTLCMYFYLFASHVFRFVSFYFVCYVLLSFPFCILLHLPHAAAAARKILWKFFFFSFIIILFHFGRSWGPRKVDSHSRGSDNYFCIQTTRKTYQPVALPTVPLSLSLALERRCPISFGFENRFLIFSVLSLVFGSFFFVFDFTLFVSLCCR